MKSLEQHKNRFTISEVKPNIFFVNFTNNYDMCMTFLRYQEYYECPSELFNGKQFTIIDFMEWYANEFGNGSFTYPRDWDGFNTPSYAIEEILFPASYGKSQTIPDWNKYDQTMLDIYNYCRDGNPVDNKFCLIASVGNTALKHEIAHGFFYLNQNYKDEMMSLINALPTKFYNRFKKILLQKGYTDKVFDDEI
ncbi:MAG: hypothetical protein LC122_14385 [Chitinophagales bacterium]|nr:hypothetical protein [Chitinophagales bacterium]